MERTTAITSVDVLPLDIEIGARAGKNPEEVAGVFHQHAGPAIAEALQARGYRVGAMIDWDGSFWRPGFPREQAMNGDDLLATEQSLALFGAAQAQRPSELLFPYLPARLGDATGSDATLYVGGYGYSGKDGSGVSVGKIIVGVLLVAVVVVIIAVAIGGKGGGGGLGSAAGNAASAAGRAVGGVARVAVRAGDAMIKVGLRTAQAIGNGNVNIDCCHHHPHYDYYYDPHYSGGSGAYSHGHTSGGVEVYIPVEQGQPPPPTAATQPPTGPVIPQMPQTGPSRTYLEMTLVDNHTGRVLWHARQIFHANPGQPGDAREVMKRMLATLPLRAGL